MGYAGRQQANGRELIRLGELCFELHALGNVIHDYDAADDFKVARNQGSDGHIGAAALAAASLQAEAIEVMHARLILQAAGIL